MSDSPGYILILDGSTEVCSVALVSSQGTLVANRMEREPSKQSERLAPMVHEVLSSLPSRSSLEGVVVAEGPGSYTGLRIVAGYAKGLCMALDIPLFTVTTTELLAHTFLAGEVKKPEDALLLPMIDARRMEVYAGLYSSDVEVLSDIKALILTDPEVQETLKKSIGNQKVFYFGSGAAKAVELFRTLIPTAEYRSGILPDAAALASKATELMASKADNALDPTYWEPFYLKEYEAKVGVPNKVLERLKKK